MQPATTARQSKNGSHVRNATSIWSSYPHIAHTWTRLSVSGKICRPMSRTTASVPLMSSSLRSYYPACEKQFLKNGGISEVRSQTTFTSFLTKTFGFWSEGGISRNFFSLRPCFVCDCQDKIPSFEILSKKLKWWMFSSISNKKYKVFVFISYVYHALQTSNSWTWRVRCFGSEYFLYCLSWVLLVRCQIRHYSLPWH